MRCSRTPWIIWVSVQNRAIICRNHPSPSLEGDWAYACEPGSPLSTWCVSLFASSTRIRSVQGALPCKLQTSAQVDDNLQISGKVDDSVPASSTFDIVELCVRGHQILKSPSPHTGATQDCWSTLFTYDVVRSCSRNRIPLQNSWRFVIKPVNVTPRNPTCKGPRFQIGCPSILEWCREDQLLQILRNATVLLSNLRVWSVNVLPFSCR